MATGADGGGMKGIGSRDAAAYLDYGTNPMTKAVMQSIHKN